MIEFKIGKLQIKRCLLFFKLNIFYDMYNFICMKIINYNKLYTSSSDNSYVTKTISSSFSLTSSSQCVHYYDKNNYNNYNLKRNKNISIERKRFKKKSTYYLFISKLASLLYRMTKPNDIESENLLSNHNNQENENSEENNNNNENAIRSKEIKSILLSLSSILVYYCFSILLTFYNRHIFVKFNYPLSITMVHLIFKFITAATIRTAYNLFYCNAKKRVLLDWSSYWRRIVPTGAASATDIGFSNWSLQYITITLYTMSKSTAILFIFFFSILFKLEKWVNYNIIYII